MSWTVNSTTTTIVDYASFSWWFDRWHKHWQPIKIHQNLQAVAKLSGCRSPHLAAAANLVSPCLVIKIILTQVDGLLGRLHATTVTTTIAKNKDIVVITFGVIWWMTKTLSQSKPVRIYRTRSQTCCSGHLLIQHDGGHLHYFSVHWSAIPAHRYPFYSSIINLRLPADCYGWIMSLKPLNICKHLKANKWWDWKVQPKEQEETRKI